MTDVADTSIAFREISAIIASQEPLEMRIERLTRLANEHFEGAIFLDQATPALSSATTELTSSATNRLRGCQLLAPGFAEGSANLDDLQTRLAQAFVNAYGLLSHQLNHERKAKTALLSIRATNEMIMALLTLDYDSIGWQQVTEAIIGRLFPENVAVFSLNEPPSNTPVATWVAQVRQSLYFNDLPARGVVISDHGQPVIAAVAAVDQASAQAITVWTTNEATFNQATLAIVQDCLRIYVTGLSLVQHQRQWAKQDSIVTTIISNLDIGVLGLTEDSTIVFANRQAAHLLGHTPGELIQSRSNAISEQFGDFLLSLGTSPTPWLMTNTILRKPSGKPQPASIAVRRVDGAHGYRYLVTLVDTSRSHFELEEWRWHASHDPLTGILNRNGLAEGVRHLVEASAMVLFLDIDRFKVINDLLGHQGGDRVITAVAQRLVNATKPNDVVARVGGDEFVVVAPVDANFHNLKRVAQRIVGAITTQPIDVGDRQLAISVSMGAALETYTGSLDALLGRADHAMYEAKREGQALHLARGEDEPFLGEPQLVDPNAFDFLRDRDANQVVALEIPWLRVHDNRIFGSDLTLTWSDSIPETPRDYAMRNHLQSEYNWLLLHHLLRREPTVGRIGISPLAPTNRFIERLERLSRAKLVKPDNVQIVLRSGELVTDQALEEALVLVRRARALGISIALRWASGEGGEVAHLSYLRPDQAQIDVAGWVDRPPTQKLSFGLTAFVRAMNVDVAFLHPNQRFLNLLTSPRLRELLPDVLVRS
jgi:diguanylate cyclase (GGDEF)-like protein